MAINNFAYYYYNVFIIIIFTNCNRSFYSAINSWLHVQRRSASNKLTAGNMLPSNMYPTAWQHVPKAPTQSSTARSLTRELCCCQHSLTHALSLLVTLSLSLSRSVAVQFIKAHPGALCVITLLPFSLHYFAFICGNFVLLLAAWQHPCSLSLSRSPTHSLSFTRQCHLRLSWLSNKARQDMPPSSGGDVDSDVSRDSLVLNVAYIASSDLVCARVGVRVCVCECACGADSNYYAMSSDNWIQ